MKYLTDMTDGGNRYGSAPAYITTFNRDQSGMVSKIS